jgi:hypothetical protein
MHCLGSQSRDLYGVRKRFWRYNISEHGDCAALAANNSYRYSIEGRQRRDACRRDSRRAGHRIGNAFHFSYGERRRVDEDFIEPAEHRGFDG